MAFLPFMALMACQPSRGASSAPPAPDAGSLGRTFADRPWLHAWLRTLLALAVTMLLSLLPFKAPAMSPPALDGSLTGQASMHDAAMAPSKLASVPALLKVAKKSSRKSWQGDTDAKADAFSPRLEAAPQALRHRERREATAPRPATLPRLRAPPLG